MSQASGSEYDREMQPKQVQKLKQVHATVQRMESCLKDCSSRKQLTFLGTCASDLFYKYMHKVLKVQRITDNALTAQTRE
jgi:hypothetical protein